MRNHRMRAIQTALLALALCTTVMTGCGGNAPEAETVEKEEDVVLQEDQVTTTDKDAEEDQKEDATSSTDETADATEKADDAGATEEEKPATQGQRVGAEGTGFVTIPDTWVEFHDTDGNSSLQWCDGTPYTVISLTTFDMDSVPEDQREGFGIEDAGNSVWINILNDGVDEEAIQGAHVKLAGRDAVQVYALYPDGSFLVTWLLQDDAGVIRYVAAEGTEKTIMDSVGIVESTYEL